MLALIVFQKLQQELGKKDSELSEAEALALLLSALNNLPDITASRQGDHSIEVKSLKNSRSFKINALETIDSLRAVWNDYLEEVEAQN